ncbi:MAG: hypothetical protein WD407_09730 [Rhodospirillales bacterium]
MNTRTGRGLKILVSMLLAVLLGSCYLPLRFDAEIDLTRQGYYTMTFIGFMTKVDLYRKIQTGEIKGADIDKQLKLIETDFKRSTNTKEFSVFDRTRAIFKIRWEKKGDILKDRMVTFIRRNEAMLNIIYNKDKSTIAIQGAGIAMAHKKRLLDMGLNTSGVLKVTTDARIISSNATKEQNRRDGKRGKEFTWQIDSILAPKPVLMIDFR